MGKKAAKKQPDPEEEEEEEEDEEEADLTSESDPMMDAIWSQVNYGRMTFGSFRNAHEGFAVMLEEVDELWDSIKLNQKKHPERDNLIWHEAVQVAAMAIRIIMECGKADEPGEEGQVSPFLPFLEQAK
jgi:hypothetical protein